LGVDRLVALAVQVVWVECADCGKCALVLFVCEVGICALTVPSELDQGLSAMGDTSEYGENARVEAVVTDHRESFLREGALAL